MLIHVIAAFLDTLPQQPLDIWNDPNALARMAIGVGILGALATFGAAIYTIRQGRTKRRIGFQIVSDAPIVTVNSTVSGKVQILFNGLPAEETRVLVLKVRNAGNSSIHKEDYFEPLSFDFDTEVISADILATEPPTLLKPHERKNFLVLEKQSVQFPPFPLNRRDALIVTVLLKDESAVRVNGRLDQGKIMKLTRSETVLLLSVLLGVLGVLLVSGITVGIAQIFGESLILEATVGLAATIVAILAIAAILARSRYE